MVSQLRPRYRYNPWSLPVDAAPTHTARKVWMAQDLPALVQPFHGERYAATERLSQRLAPPYDVLTATTRTAYAERSNHNIVHLTLPAGDGADRYRRAAETLAEWRRSHALIRDEEPAVYVVQQEFRTPDGKTHFRTGVVGAVHVEPYDAGRVRPHEATRAGPKEDRLALMRATEAVLEAIFLLARDESGELLRLLHAACRREPTAVADLDGTAVGLWRVAGDDGARIAAVAGADALYIADGHHRYETATAYRDEHPAAARVPGLIVPVRDPGLVVLPTHRMLSGAVPLPEVLAEVDAAAREVHPIANPELTVPLLEELGEEGPACAVVLADGTRRAWLFGAGDGEPGIALVERHVMTPLVAAAGDGAAVRYTPAHAEAIAGVEAGQAAAAVLVNPTPVEEVLEVSDRGGVLPPKSTYFFPKVPSGLVLLDCREAGD